MTADDLEAVTALDRLATGEDRRARLAAFAPFDGGVVLAGADGTIEGWVVRPPWGGGATVAANLDSGVRLLDDRRRRAGPARTVRAGLPEEHAAGCERLESLGWTPGWTARRMERGPRVEWRPEMIYGQFTMAIG
jgi:hypothetical protein